MSEVFVFVVLALATFRVTRLVVVDELFSGLRDRFWSRFPPSTRLGYLLTCSWCTSVWVASLFVLCYTIFSTATLVFATVFALSAVASLIAAHWDA